MKKIILNHFYRLRHDQKRSYIISSDNIAYSRNENVDFSWISKVHPVYAMMLSFFSKPIELHDAITRLSCFFDISDNDAENIITPFINCNKPFCTEYEGVLNYFPSNLVIDYSESVDEVVEYSPIDFIYTELEFKQERFYQAPMGLVFMVNNICVTDCIYCYADRLIKRNTLSLETIEKIVKNASDLNVLDFGISGGEFFLYKEWTKLLDVFIRYNYKPSLLSTKIPLTEKDIITFKRYDIPLQISLDSLNREVLMTVLNVGETYLSKMKRTIELLEHHEIKFQIATVLTKHNDTIDNLETIYEFLSNFKNIKRWEIRVAFKSLYTRADFNTIKISKSAIENIRLWIDSVKEKTNFNILWSPEGTSKYFKCKKGSRQFEGSRCSANYSHMVLLPYWEVTICEQLYWDPLFLIGDLSKQTIQEVWNSSRALELAFPTRENFRNESVCKTCDILDECLSFPNKCIADVMKGYGRENWDYPDPRCEKAPAFIHDLTHI